VTNAHLLAICTLLTGYGLLAYPLRRLCLLRLPHLRFHLLRLHDTDIRREALASLPRSCARCHRRCRPPPPPPARRQLSAASSAPAPQSAGADGAVGLPLLTLTTHCRL
jgi:hypothetical protein